MDDRSFDRIARLFGAATDRRAGLRALLAGLVAGAVAGSGAEAAKRGKDAEPEDVADDAEDGPDGERRKRRCKPAGKRCRKAGRCCSKVCIKTKKGRRKRGACGCRAAGEPCTETVNCCAVDGSQLQCVNGACARIPVETGQVCVEGDTCADPLAACTIYRRTSRENAATLCLLGGGAPCTKDQACVSLTCENGTCAGDALVPLGDPCVPGQAICADGRATCVEYRAGSGGPGGFYCLAPDGAACASPVTCVAYACEAGACGRQPLPSGDVCDPTVDHCAAADATCTTYSTGSDPDFHCLLPPGARCGGDNECIARRCRNQTCEGGPVLVPTGQPCTNDPEIDRCQDSAASCRGYAEGSGGPAGSFCLLPDDEACTAAAQCVAFACVRDTCAGSVVPNGQPCDPARDLCQDPRATCAGYAEGSGGPAGTHCVLPEPEPCAGPAECVGYVCESGTCGADPVPTGNPCGAQDTCLDAPVATCVEYAAEGMPGGAHCLLPDGAPCSALDQCRSAYCNAQGTCGPCTLIESGSTQTCASGAECCSGVCDVVAGVGRCIGPNQVSFRLRWAPEVDLDSWLWLPQSVPNRSSTGESFVPEGAGDIVTWRRRRYPCDYLGDQECGATTPPDAWLDVDDRDGGEERTMILKPVSGSRYRFAVKNYDACRNDKDSTTACGLDWSNLDESQVPLLQSGAVVEFYRGGVLERLWPVVSAPVGSEPGSHYYWWHVADVVYDDEGNFASVVDGSGLLTCAPDPYAMEAYTPGSREVTNYCIPG